MLKYIIADEFRAGSVEPLEEFKASITIDQATVEVDIVVIVEELQEI